MMGLFAFSRVRVIALAIGFALIATACGTDLDIETARSGPAEEGGTPNRIFGDPIPPTPEEFNGLTDTDQAIVPLNEVVFDTFDGGSITLDEANDGDVVRLLDAIPPIDNPAYICLLYTSPSPRDGLLSRMPSSA